VPRRWGFDEEHFVVTQPGWLGVRRNQWKLGDVKSVEFTRVKGILSKWSAGRVVIRVKGRRLALRAQGYGKKIEILEEFTRLLQKAPEAHQIGGTKNSVE
jgi:hypothetical protein